MGIFSQPQWSRSGFTPFATPEPVFMNAEGREGLFVTDWATGVTQQECRQCPRRPMRHELLITDPDWWETENPLPIRGECLNLSEEGLYAVVPDGLGMAVGQRYLFEMHSERDEDRLSRLGTIVRMEMTLGHGHDQVGIGVRLEDTKD
ncbi:MAG TPA: PilZ domain-containing protein [Phycisphaerae bacterium]|jgi:hypothetical protein|nr:PilZ domain-containing protein [Phycisphaerae bacterium]HOB73922.1 PilZ domain-containing protein [Phycisphaerae bacterium]HOJ56280.1 PilZ domain-containing protein [Phycisphaerae bacterium]HOL28128.1 PilZ domain-containing protein [Phycisphaerae bacterium]HPP19761.1 PilZ domain-containing protein [Phycisphaerae bacterium]